MNCNNEENKCSCKKEMNTVILKCIDDLVAEYGCDKEKLIRIYNEDYEQPLQFAQDDKILKEYSTK